MIRMLASCESSSQAILFTSLIIGALAIGAFLFYVKKNYKRMRSNKNFKEIRIKE